MTAGIDATANESRVNPDERQRVMDEEHLRLLALFHYISGGMTVACAAFFGFMAAMMTFVFSAMPPPAVQPCAEQDPCGAPAAAIEPFPATLFLVFFGTFATLMLALGVLEILSGRCIARRRRRVFSLVIAIPRLLAFPYGTLLSIFTLLVLDRSTVKALYAPPAA